MDLIAALLLFCVYSGCVLMCLMTGAGVYRRTVDEGEVRFSSRTTLSYLTARVRSASGRVTVTDFGDGDALALTETVDGATFVTYIYSYGGYLCELYTDPTLQLPPDAGEPIAPADPLQIERIAPRLLQISLGGQEPIFLALTRDAEVAQ